MATEKIKLKRLRVPSYEEYQNMSSDEKKIVDFEVKQDLIKITRNIPPAGDREGRLFIFNALYEYLAPMFLYISSVSSAYETALDKKKEQPLITLVGFEKRVYDTKKLNITELPNGYDYSIVLKLLKPFGRNVGSRLSMIITQIKSKRFYNAFLNYLLRFSSGIAKNFSKKMRKVEQQTVAIEEIVGGRLKQIQISEEEQEEEFQIGERYDLIKSRLVMYIKMNRLTPNEKIALMLLDKGKLEPTDSEMSKGLMYENIGISRRKQYLELLERATKRLQKDLTPKERRMYNDFITLGMEKLGEFFDV